MKQFFERFRISRKSRKIVSVLLVIQSGSQMNDCIVATITRLQWVILLYTDGCIIINTLIYITLHVVHKIQPFEMFLVTIPKRIHCHTESLLS